MALGVPVVASNRGALPEVVGDGGILVDPARREAAWPMPSRPSRLTRDLAREAARRGHRPGGPIQLAGVGARRCVDAYARAVARAPGAGARRREDRAHEDRDRRAGVDRARRPASGAISANCWPRWADPASGAALRHEFVLYGPAPLSAAVAVAYRTARGEHPGGAGRRRHRVGADDAAVGRGARRAGRVLRAGVHGSPAALLSRRR